MQKFCVDGQPVPGVVQATIDGDKTTLIYDVAKSNGTVARRAITVETEAVTIV